MKRSKTISWILIVLSIIGLFAVWYDWQYSMDKAEEYQINASSADYSLLIATQGSEYKNSVTESIVEALSPEGIYINVIDVHNLKNQDPNDYNGIVIIHTIEMYKAPKCATEFVAKTDRSKIFALATSGDGEYKMENVDGITSASPILDSKKHASQIVKWYRENIFEI